MRRTGEAAVGGVLAVLAVATIADPLAFVADDSWFYLVIGRNVADGHGITFSRVLPTNGFQPLWGGVVSLTLFVAHALGQTSAISEIRAVLLVGWALLAGGLWLLRGLLARIGVGPAGQVVGVAAAVAYLGGPLGTLGSEANLVFLLVVAAVSAVVRLTDRRDDPVPGAGGAPRATPGLRSVAVVGLLLGAMVLGRLDTGFTAVAALLALAVLLPGGPVVRLRAAAVAGLAAAAVVGPYLAWNQARFGHLMPIAGAIKVDPSQGLLLRTESLGRVGWLLLGAAVAAGLAGFARRRPPRTIAAWAVPMAGGLASAAVYLSFSTGEITDLDWYRMPQLVALCVGLAVAWERVGEASVRQSTILAGAVAAILVPALLWVQYVERVNGANHDFWHPVEDFSRQVGATVPADGIIATVDYPGVVAAVSGRRVVALDGLTGDYAFQDDLRDRGGPCTLRDLGVGWLVVDDDSRLLPVRTTDGTGYEVEVTSWLHRETAGHLFLDPNDRALADPTSGLSLWRVEPTCPG